VDKSATDADVTKAYRNLARKVYPDKRPNDREKAEEEFKKTKLHLLNVAEKTTAAAATSSALRRRARPWEGAHRRRRLPLAIFCDQVFFDYDPSSSTSLLSSAMGQTKAKNRNGNGGDWSETQWRCLAENQRTRWDS